RAKNTLLLAATAMVVTWLLGVPLGVWTATQHGRWTDRLVEAGNSLLISIPEIVTALGLLALALRWRVLPVCGMSGINHDDLSAWGRIREVANHMVLPAAILVLGGVAVVVRHVRASVVEVLAAPYVVAARGHGISRGRLLFRHVMPVAANPAISLLGFSIAGLLSGSLVVEVATGWPGLGPLLLEATLARDLYLVIGGIMASAVFMVAGNFAA